MARPSKKQAIVEAAVALVAQGGAAAATVRAIAGGARVTEAAVYRHFASKTGLLQHAYAGIVQDMIAEKERIAAGRLTFAEKLSEWVRVTFTHFDVHPHAFAFVFLTCHTPDSMDPKLTSRQGWLFQQLFTEALSSGEARPLDPALAMSQFSGLMLNVPRLINTGDLPGPARDYLQPTVIAVHRLLLAEEVKDSSPKMRR